MFVVCVFRCLSMCIFDCVSVCSLVCPCVCLFFSQTLSDGLESLDLFVCLLQLFLCVSVCLFVCRFICLCVFLYVCLSVCLFDCLCERLFVCLLFLGFNLHESVCSVCLSSAFVGLSCSLIIVSVCICL